MGANTYVNDERLKQAVRQLATGLENSHICHYCMGGEPLPVQDKVKEIIALCRELIFPGFFGGEAVNSRNMEYMVGTKCERLLALLDDQVAAGLVLEAGCGCHDLDALKARAHGIAMDLVGKLPELRRRLVTDVDAIYLGDPAAKSYDEVIYCYPSIRAITNYRIAHELLLAGVPVIARMISESAHGETGIDIHPGAEIGERFAIDHGTGVVIGATAIIGRNVKLYQGVTLGARSFPLDDNGNPIKGIARHPIIGDNVVIYSNATILGRIRIGNNAVIGGNIWVASDVADGERLIQAKANNIVRVKKDNDREI